MVVLKVSLNILIAGRNYTICELLHGFIDKELLPQSRLPFPEVNILPKQGALEAVSCIFSLNVLQRTFELFFGDGYALVLGIF